MPASGRLLIIEIPLILRIINSRIFDNSLLQYQDVWIRYQLFVSFNEDMKKSDLIDDTTNIIILIYNLYSISDSVWEAKEYYEACCHVA